MLMKAKVPVRPGDHLNDPAYNKLIPLPSTSSLNTLPEPPQKQKSITDFFPKQARNINLSISPCTSLTDVSTSKSTTKTRPKNKTKGYNYCNTPYCRYCPLLDKSGHIKSAKDEKFTAMKNISCRSSNLIYCITCTRCHKQYVGQTLLRIKDRFIHHFRDIEINNKDKSVSRHFNSPHHLGTKDMRIHVLEFIRKPPRSPQAANIRNRRETSWMHTLRCLAPSGLNMENPKEYKSHLKKQNKM